MTMILLGLPFGLGILLITFSTNVVMLLTGRFLYGLSSGAFGLLVPTYTSETAEPRIKGAMGSLLNLLVVFGNLFIAVMGKYLEWRTMTGILLFIPVLMALWMLNMPESPVQLVKKGKDSQAKKSLKFLRGPKCDIDRELEDIQSQVRESEAVDSVNLSSLVLKREYLVPSMISLTLMFLQQFSGITAILPYAVQLFEDAGLGDTIDAFTCNILVSVTNIVFGVISLLLVDRLIAVSYFRQQSYMLGIYRLGRRILLIVSDVFMGLSMAALGYYFYRREVSQESIDGGLIYLPIVATLCFIASFDIGLGMRELNRKMSFNLFWYFFLFHPIDFSMYSSSRLGSQLGTLFKRSKNPGFHIRSHFQLDMCFSGRLLLSHY